MMGAMTGEAGKMEGEIGFLVKIVEAIKEIDSNPVNRHIARQRVIEHIKVDFAIMEERLISVIRMVNEGKATKEDYRNAFCKLWSDNAPAAFVNILKRDAEKGVDGAIKFQELILEMGDKLYALLDGDSRVCVSTEIPPIPCEKCYFASICKLAVKNKPVCK